MSEEILIRQGAPTLAGIKTGSLFPCPCDDREALLTDVRRLNRQLVPKGLCLLPIRFKDGQALLYLYRPAVLHRDLQDGLAQRILTQAGYACGGCGRCVAQLIRRFRESGEFPHEVGAVSQLPAGGRAGLHRPPRLRLQVCGPVEGIQRRGAGPAAVHPLQALHRGLLRPLAGRFRHRSAGSGHVTSP